MDTSYNESVRQFVKRLALASTSVSTFEVVVTDTVGFVAEGINLANVSNEFILVFLLYAFFSWVEN